MSERYRCSKQYCCFPLNELSYPGKGRRGDREGSLTCSLFFPRSRTYRGTDLVKYAVTKGALTMASTAWMKDKDDRAMALVMQPMLEVKSV